MQTPYGWRDNCLGFISGVISENAGSHQRDPFATLLITCLSIHVFWQFHFQTQKIVSVCNIWNLSWYGRVKSQKRIDAKFGDLQSSVVCVAGWNRNNRPLWRKEQSGSNNKTERESERERRRRIQKRTIYRNTILPKRLVENWISGAGAKPLSLHARLYMTNQTSGPLVTHQNLIFVNNSRFSSFKCTR